MHIKKATLITAEIHILQSKLLDREVTVSVYYPPSGDALYEMELLLINDGQDLETMNFESILTALYTGREIKPLLFAGISCGADRRNEYGTARFLDYAGRGAKAALYQQFIFEELLPFIKINYPFVSLKEKSFCGFSLGGLSALDMVWNHPHEFKNAGVFSGSLWWRSVSQDDPLFDEYNDRIMHAQIRSGSYHPWLKFFFETGTMDETADRNNNGIIDSIDDTISLIDELVKKGYRDQEDILYMELKDGKHDVPTWGKAFPYFLRWRWGV